MFNPLHPLRKYAREIFIVGAGILAVLLVVSGIGSVADSACGNEVLHQELSPNKKLKAVIFQRDCGATTEFSTQISLLNAAEKLPNWKGNLFIGNDLSGIITAKWKSNSLLEIGGTNGGSSSKQENSLENVEIRYD